MDREVIIPAEMREIVASAGYAPAVKVGDTIYVVGQVGRTKDLLVIEEPQEQFALCGKTFASSLAAADCTGAFISPALKSAIRLGVPATRGRESGKAPTLSLAMFWPKRWRLARRKTLGMSEIGPS